MSTPTQPTFFGKYESSFSQKKFVVSCCLALIFLAISLGINYVAGEFATEYQSNSVTDVILSNTPVFDLDEIFVGGSLVFAALITYLCFANPKNIPYTVKSIAFFTITRSVFVSLTHIGAFPQRAILDPASFISKFTFGGDLFFSGHTGMPFLIALIFWHNRFLRYLFLGISLVFAVVVLLGHRHYSIDVLGAYFITYTIFHLTELIFKKDREYFNAK